MDCFAWIYLWHDVVSWITWQQAKHSCTINIDVTVSHFNWFVKILLKWWMDGNCTSHIYEQVLLGCHMIWSEYTLKCCIYNQKMKRLNSRRTCWTLMMVKIKEHFNSNSWFYTPTNDILTRNNWNNSSIYHKME